MKLSNNCKYFLQLSLKKITNKYAYIFFTMSLKYLCMVTFALYVIQTIFGN